MNANGTGVRRLTRAATPLGDGQPAWSPDGHKLAFVVFSVRSDKHSAIYVMNADGTHVTRVTGCLTGCLDSEPAWSPDGTKIAFTRNWNVYTMSPGGREVTRLTDCPQITGCALAGGPVWSPDGQKIVFWAEGRDSIRQPYLMNADGSDARPLIPKTSDVCCFGWQPLPGTSSTRGTRRPVRRPRSRSAAAFTPRPPAISTGTAPRTWRRWPMCCPRAGRATRICLPTCAFVLRSGQVAASAAPLRTAAVAPVTASSPPPTWAGRPQRTRRGGRPRRCTRLCGNSSASAGMGFVRCVSPRRGRPRPGSRRRAQSLRQPYRRGRRHLATAHIGRSRTDRMRRDTRHRQVR